MINSKTLKLFLRIYKLVKYEQKSENIVTCTNNLQKLYVRFLKSISNEMPFFKKNESLFMENDAIEFLGIFIDQIIFEQINLLKLNFLNDCVPKTNNINDKTSDKENFSIQISKERFLEKIKDESYNYLNLFPENLNEIVIEIFDGHNKFINYLIKI